MNILRYDSKNCIFKKQTTQRIFSKKKIELFFSKKKKWLKELEFFTITWRIEVLLNMTHFFLTKIDSQNWTFFVKCDSKNWTFFFFERYSKNWILLTTTQRIEPFFPNLTLENWTPSIRLKKLTQKNRLGILFLKYDSKNWFFEYDSTNWTFFSYDSKHSTFVFKMTLRTEPFSIWLKELTQRIEFL